VPVPPPPRAQAAGTPGFTVSLLNLSVMDGAPDDVRQMAAIQFKNTVHRSWSTPLSPEAQRLAVPDADKAGVRAALVDAIVRAIPLARVQLVEALRDIVAEDYPSQWPGLLPQLVGNLGSGDQRTIHGTLFAVRMVCRRYEYKSDEQERRHLDEVVGALFPTLLGMFSQLAGQPWVALEQADMMKLTLKAFWSATYLHIPTPLSTADVFLPWLEQIMGAITHPVPEGGPDDEELRAKWPWWKLKKWAMHIMGRVLDRLGSPQKLNLAQDQVASESFRSQCLVPVTEAYLSLAAQYTAGTYLSPRCSNLLLAYLSDAMAYSPSYAVMKPHMESLLMQLVFPHLCFNDSDKELWEEDPQEYIRKGYDVIEDLYSEKNAAVSFILDMAEKRAGGQNKKKGTSNLGTFLGHIAGALNDYTSAGAGASEAVARRMDGALLAIGALASTLKEKGKYKASIEPMMSQHVIPCFASPYGFLRSKACWVAHMYADLKFSDGRGKGRVFQTMFESVIRCLSDPEMPVKVDACLALGDFVETMDHVDMIKPILPQLLTSIFALMSEVEHEDLVVTLETIVEVLGDDIAPYAVDLARQLTGALVKIMGAADADDEESAGVLAAYGCMKAMSTVVDAVSNLPHLLPPLEEVFFPVLETLLGGAHGDDLMEETLDLMTYLSYYSPEVSPRMWGLWPALLNVLNKFGVMYFENVLAVADNLISRSTAQFLANPTYKQSVVEVCRWALTQGGGEGEYTEYDSLKNAPKMLEVVLMNCRGQVDDQLPAYLAMVTEKLFGGEAMPDYFEDALALVVFQAFIYNAPLTLQVLGQAGALERVLGRMMELVTARKGKKGVKPAHFKGEYQKKVVCLGMTALLVVPDAALGPLAGSLGAVLGPLLQVLGFYKDQMEQARLDEAEWAKAEAEATDDESEDGGPGADADLDDEDGDYDEDAVTDIDFGKLRHLMGKHHDSDADSDGDFGGWDDEDDDDMFMCPLDDKDAFVEFTEALKGLQGTDPARFQALCKPELQQALQEVAMYADKRRQEIAAEKAKEAEEKAAKDAKRAAQHHA